MSMEEWRNMGEMMGGIGAMGGPPTGLLTPASTAAGAGPGVDHAAMGHGTSARDSAAGKSPMPPGMSHAMPAGDTPARAMPAGHGAKSDSTMAAMMELHERMMADPVIRKRVESDTALQRLMHEVIGMPMSAEKPKAPVTPPRAARKPSAAAKPSVKPPVKPATFELR